MQENESIPKLVVEKLTNTKRTVSTMESCTGGEVANLITSIEGSSLVFNFGAVTYSNEYKIKFGVSSELIEKYTVYSTEVAKEMSYKIALFTNSDYGIGITGKLNAQDPNNPFGENNIVYISLYDKINDKFYTQKLAAVFKSRDENKVYLANSAIDMLNQIL